MDIENTLILTPEDLEGEEVIYKNLCIQSNPKSLILGKIMDDKSCPIEGAAIVVYKQFFTSGIVHREIMGFTSTDENGGFAILVEKIDCVNYIIEVYKPLNDNIICR